MTAGTDGGAATNGASAGPPGTLRRLNSGSASALADLNARFEDLQTVLRCCERLMTELAAGSGEPDESPEGAEAAAKPGKPGDAEAPPGEHREVVIEAVWTVALLSYARCFAAGQPGTALAEADLTAAKLSDDVLDWHKVLLQLRDHYADPVVNPRERFSVVVTQDPSGSASGIGITSARQPLVDELTVRQTGAIAYALSRLVNDRIGAMQAVVFGELEDMPKAELDKLDRLEVSSPD